MKLYFSSQFISIVLFSCWLSITSFACFAEVMIYPFENEVQEIRFQSLLGELRCPKCQNQSLSDSDADIAKDLRQKIYDLLIDGKSDDEIRNYLIERYGDFITYRPPLKSSTFLLWVGPILLLLLAMSVAVLKVLPKSNKSSIANEQADEVEM